MNTNATKELSFTVISFLPRPSGSSVNTPDFKPHSVKRHVDGEIFTIGDRVTNGTDMVGAIREFGFLNDSLFVTTSWSGVGMNLDSLVKVPVLPSRFQTGDTVSIKFKKLSVPLAYVIKVHFTHKKVQYDLEINLSGKASTRLYNVDENIVEPYTEGEVANSN